MFGIACLKNKDPRRAEQFLEKALALKSNIDTTSVVGKKSRAVSSLDTISEQDVRYQIHECHIQTQNTSRALAVLQAVPPEQRSSKTLSAMASLFVKEKNKTEAIKCYEEMLVRNPLSLDAAANLIEMGVKSADIINRMGPKIQSMGPGAEWIVSWIELQACLRSFKTEKSVELARRLEDSFLRENPEVQLALAQAYFLNGDFRKAAAVYRSLYLRDLSITKGMDYYAACLYGEKDVKGLEELANRLVTRCESGDELPEPWIAISYYTFIASKKDSKALYFAQKACLSSGSSVNSLLLKARIMFENKNASEAIPYFNEAYTIAPYRFDVVKCLTEAFLADNKRQQATSLSQLAAKQFGATPRVLTLQASVLLAETEKGTNRKTAKGLLERAVNKDRAFLPAVYSLTKLLMEDKVYDKAIDVLKRCLEHENTNHLHRLLGDCYASSGEQVRATRHHNIAMKLEVSYRSPAEAQSLNASSNAQGVTGAASDQVVDADVDEMADSDNEEMEDGEQDVAWSDHFEDE